LADYFFEVFFYVCVTCVKPSKRQFLFNALKLTRLSEATINPYSGLLLLSYLSCTAHMDGAQRKRRTVWSVRRI